MLLVAIETYRSSGECDPKVVGVFASTDEANERIKEGKEKMEWENQGDGHGTVFYLLPEESYVIKDDDYFLITSWKSDHEYDISWEAY